MTKYIQLYIAYQFSLKIPNDSIGKWLLFIWQLN